MHKRPSLPSHLFYSCRLFPINFGEINARGSSTKQSKCPSPLLFARDPLVCLFSLSSKQASRLQSIIGECNEMVMLVRTIPRPAPAFRPPALNGDNNFSSRRGGRILAVYAKCDVSKPKYPFCTHVFCQSLVILERLTGGGKTEAADTCVQLNCLLLATCASVLHPQQHTPLRISQAHRHPKRPRLALFNSGAATTQKIMGAGNAVVQQHQVGNVESIRPVEHIMMKSTDRRRIFNTITPNVEGWVGQ